MPITELGIADFQDAIESNDVVLVHFWAALYPACRTFAPTYEAAARANPDLFFASVDVGAERLLASALEIYSIPTLMVFRAGSAVLTTPGACSAQHLDDVIRTARGSAPHQPTTDHTARGGTR